MPWRASRLRTAGRECHDRLRRARPRPVRRRRQAAGGRDPPTAGRPEGMLAGFRCGRRRRGGQDLEQGAPRRRPGPRNDDAARAGIRSGLLVSPRAALRDRKRPCRRGNAQATPRHPEGVRRDGPARKARPWTARWRPLDPARFHPKSGVARPRSRLGNRGSDHVVRRSSANRPRLRSCSAGKNTLRNGFVPFHTSAEQPLGLVW